MPKIAPEHVFVAVDIGTTKICVLVAQYLGNNALEILGVGSTPSVGLKKGVVVDVAQTTLSIKKAIKEAELMAGVEIASAHVGIAGGHIQSTNSHGIVPINRGQIKSQDIVSVVASAQAIPLAEGQQLLHALPQYFIIDGEHKVKDPLGMHGVRLEAQVHLVTGSVASVQDIISCCTQAGIAVQDVVLEQLASAGAVLTEDERELGVAMLDIGGGTADLAIYQRGSIRHTMVLPVAGNHFTNDLAVGLRTSIAEAERIKRAYGSVSKSAALKKRKLIIQAPHGETTKQITDADLVRILRPRAHELLSLVHRNITQHHLQSFMTSGLVLTGGGSLLDGMSELAHEIFGVPVRLGQPKSTYTLPESLRSPIYSTAYGLLVYAMNKGSAAVTTNGGPLISRVFDRMKSWVADFF